MTFEEPSVVASSVPSSVLPTSSQEVSDLEGQAVMKAEQFGESARISESVSELKTEVSPKTISVTKEKKSFTRIVAKQTPQVEEVKTRLKHLRHLIKQSNVLLH